MKDNVQDAHIQEAVNAALIEASMEPHVPFDIKKMAEQLGFAVRNFYRIPAHIIGIMFLQMDEKMSKMVNAERLIGLNPQYDLPHQRFAIAHELGHYQMHQEQCMHEDNPVFFQTKDDEIGIEQEACKFAAFILMDKNQFSKAYNALKAKQCEPIEIIRSLSKQFVAPQSSVVRRIKELRLHG